MKDFGLVSIITPAYNCERFIAETIQSVINQTYRNWEIIIVDDCSADKTQEIVLSYQKKDTRILFLKNDNNEGSAFSRNRALSIAKGKWIAFLDSDDLWLPEKLERQIEFMNENNYHFSYTNYSEIDENSIETGISLTGPEVITKNKMQAYCWPGCLTIMYDSDFVGKMKCADLKINEEYALWIKISKITNCYLLNENLAKYRRRNDSLTSQSFLNLIKWHYLMFRRAENENAFVSLFHTIGNLFFGICKKLFYRKRYNP